MVKYFWIVDFVFIGLYFFGLLFFCFVVFFVWIFVVFLFFEIWMKGMIISFVNFLRFVLKFYMYVFGKIIYIVLFLLISF